MKLLEKCVLFTLVKKKEKGGEKYAKDPMVWIVAMIYRSGLFYYR